MQPPAPAPAANQILPSTTPYPDQAEDPAFPAQHPQLGARIFAWSPPPKTRLLNTGMVLLAASFATALAGKLAGLLSGAAVGVTFSLAVLYGAVWALARVPSGTPCAAYQLGLATAEGSVTWGACRLGVEATRHQFATQGGETFEDGESFEVLVLGPDGFQARMKGWGDEYGRLAGWFRDHVQPLVQARERAQFGAGERVRCGRWHLHQGGLDVDEGPKLTWDQVEGASLDAGWIRVRTRDGQALETLVSNPGGPFTVEVLRERGFLSG